MNPIQDIKYKTTNPPRGVEDDFKWLVLLFLFYLIVLVKFLMLIFYLFSFYLKASLNLNN